MAQLQAHRGVCTEYPENTMPAFLGAVRQGYDIIELDPNVTEDGVFVILHDDTLTRTARNADGSDVNEIRKISEMPYIDVSEYDYGVWFSPKFKGVRIPLLEDVLLFAEENGIQIKIDNKIWNFPGVVLDKLWRLLENTKASVGITCNSLETVRKTVEKLPFAEIHYDGEVSEFHLVELKRITNRLTVWLPFQTKKTNWVKVPFATEELCALVKQYAKLGIWIVSNDKDYDLVQRLYKPDIVETAGQIKPVRNSGYVIDMHTHSMHSHDSQCLVDDMAKYQRQHGTNGFAVTDHCDVFKTINEDVVAEIVSSVEDVNNIKKREDDFKILSGVEIGEGIWFPETVEKLMDSCDFDVVIASVHTIKYQNYENPCSRIDFSTMTVEKIYGYLEKYYDDLYETIRTIPCDIVAHINLPFRYINGKYRRGIPCQKYEKQVRKILGTMIEQGMALEVNTSCMEPDGADSLENDWLLEIIKEMGGHLITLGSDAHIREKAAQNFDQGVHLIKRHGFKNCFYYERRNSIQCRLV